jgi:hypothetical protein
MLNDADGHQGGGTAGDEASEKMGGVETRRVLASPPWHMCRFKA